MSFKLLNQPYPFTTSEKKKVIQAFLFGLFVFIFLAIFQPFDAQGLSLKFEGANVEEIPVSRSYVAEIKAAL